MVGSGVGKFVSTKFQRYILLVIVIVIAILVAVSYISAVFGEFIEPPKKGEKTRFMRYMECALAMCAAPNRKDDSDGCTSDKVMGLTVEYDEEGYPVKGCQKVCEEIRDSVGVDDHYCRKDYAINFTFQDSVTYIGNYSCEGLEGIVAGKETGPCGMKTGRQTDISLFYNWGRFMSCEINNCQTPSLKPYGRSVNITSGCGTNPACGSIGISDVLSSKCEPDDVGISNGLGLCRFDIGDEVFIWSETYEKACFGICVFDICIIPLPSIRNCPKLAICEHD